MLFVWLNKNGLLLSRLHMGKLDKFYADEK